MRYLLIMLLGLLPVLAGAVEIDEATRHLPLGKIMQVYEDRDGSASIAQVSAPIFASRFRTHHQDVLNAGYSHSVFWLKVELHYVASANAQPRQWLLELAYPPMDHIELYLPGSDGEFVLARRTGDALPYASRPIRQNNYLFELPLQPGQSTTAYLRLDRKSVV